LREPFVLLWSCRRNNLTRLQILSPKGITDNNVGQVHTLTFDKHLQTMPPTMYNLQPLDLLRHVRILYTQSEIAKLLDVDVRTVRRWEVRDKKPPTYLADAIYQRLLPLVDIKYTNDCPFTFVDLFAGIGGIRLGFEAQGGRCVFTSEWNAFSQKTYLANFPESSDHVFVGDITSVNENDVPNHDILLAGFPCQPFSIAGVSKKNALGLPHGFECATQGTLFFDVARIIATKRPKAFVLENVKNLLSHDKGNTFQVILQTLRNELGYDVHYKVIDGQRFVPQHRERIIIVGFRDKNNFSWDDLQLPTEKTRLSSILHPQNGKEKAEEPYTLGAKAIVNTKYTLTPKLWAYLQAYAEKHRAAGNGFGFGLVDADSISRTLSARYYKDGSEILVSQGDDQRPRRLTPRECARLMGFPDNFQIPVSDTQAYRQFGNSVVMPVMKEVARIVVPQAMEAKKIVIH
jgi:DNA (cytosine-5)-methyltransferase 1